MKTLATVCLSLTAALLLLPAAAAQPGGQADLKLRVDELLAKIEVGGDAAVAAEWELLKIGPDALAVLPATDKPARLAPLRATLQQVRPMVWSQPRTEMPLAEALKLLRSATLSTLADRRQQSTGGMVTVDFKNFTYWQAVDAFAAQTKSRVSLYQQDGQIALVDGPTPKMPLSHHGLFRVAFKRVHVKSDLDAGTHVCEIGLELAWEPRFQPYLIEAGAAKLTAKGPGGKPFVAELPSHGPVRVTETRARETDLLFPAPSRAVAAVKELSGQFVVTMPNTTHIARFPKGVKKSQPLRQPDGVSVALLSVEEGKESWTVQLAVEYPPAGPTLATHQTWLGTKAWLDAVNCTCERGIDDNREVMRPDPLRTSVGGKANEGRVTVTYQFPVKGAQTFANWRLVAEVPGRLVELTVPYAFKDVELP
jgi:hypothetical protein